MKTISARDAKCHFGELMDTMQREPILISYFSIYRINMVSIYWTDEAEQDLESILASP